MTDIILSIENCTSCPFCKQQRCYTEDSWEEAYDYICTKTNKEIAGYMEWHDKMPAVPYWCPIRTD